MGYKKNIRNSFLAFFLSAIGIVLFSCSNNKKQNNKNTYYVEVSSCPDSLKQNILSGLVGKTTYFKNKKLEIMSVNYVTEDYPGMHYFKHIAEITPPVAEGTRKILIQFAGNFTYDSTLYSIQKFTYKNKEWVKYSDMGFIKANSDPGTPKTAPFNYRELHNQVVHNVVESTY